MHAIVDKSEAVGVVEDAREDLNTVDCSPLDVEDDELEHEAEEESDRPRGIRDPGRPSPAEVAEHDLTHIPARPWCKHCVRGKAKTRPSLRICGSYSENLAPRVRLDYCFLTENSEEEVAGGGEAQDPATEANEETTSAVAQEELEETSRSSLTVLVMQESECRSVWAYAVEHKGSTEEWAVDQICEDLDTIGLRNDRIIVKSDQESSANDIAREISKRRASEYGTGLENSAIGDSNSNGTVERAIQDMEGQARTLRSA